VTRIRATCPSCGEIELRPADVLLRRVLDRSGEVLDGSSYRFSCPDCTVVVEKPADDRVASLLTTGGVPTEDITPPAEAVLPPHPEQPAPGPALTLDDLLDLHLALEDPTWFDRFAPSSPTRGASC
jgi:predicted RNA-binding Zn-ribbon protein involved in translation (DUF1610 family)